MIVLTDENKEKVIADINKGLGPKVRWVNAEIGYGLFAEKDYKQFEFVTFYGGVECDPDFSGDYVVSYDEGKKAINAEFEFETIDKGRWINENPEDELNQNVDLACEPGEKPFFYTVKHVKQGEQFFWWYGEEYERPWKNKKIECFICGKNTDLICEFTKIPYCSVECQRIK